jgi:23S rRNA (adenine1618-N6)-methyltransferase
MIEEAMEKTKKLHERNIHNKNYNFDDLSKASKSLIRFIKVSESGKKSINFENPQAIIELNKALLIKHYDVKDWAIPEGHLCPPVPGRADYIHYIADLIRPTDSSSIPVGKSVKGLDVGTGAGCIYPILGNSIYGWRFVGSEINSDSINSSKKILSANSTLKKNISLRFQKSEKDIFLNIMKDELFDFTMCNPPFYTSLDEANMKSAQKKDNLAKNKKEKSIKASPEKDLRNFGGINSELWCKGGELAFIKLMIKQSIEVQNKCRWFTTLVSNKENLTELKNALKLAKAEEVKVIKMETSNKITHILAWTYL